MNTKSSYGKHKGRVLFSFGILFVFLFLSSPGFGEEKALKAILEHGQCVGYTISQVWTTFGPPEEIYPVRGDNEKEDNVVFYYPDHYYLFFFHNRVWQVRMDRRYRGRPLDLPLLSKREKVEEVLGPPFAEVGESLIYHLGFTGYPIRGRLFFEEGTLIDVYIYRGDY
jgi:hypothetical protein